MRVILPRFSNNMKILIVTGIYPLAIGGSATYSALLKRELPSRGFEVAVLTYGASDEQNIFVVSISGPASAPSDDIFLNYCSWHARAMWFWRRSFWRGDGCRLGLMLDWWAISARDGGLYLGTRGSWRADLIDAFQTKNTVGR